MPHNAQTPPVALAETDLATVVAGAQKGYIAAAAFVTYRDLALEMILGPWKSGRQGRR